MKDYYEVLGVPRDADQDEIKRAFRRLARETHPDANPDDPHAEARFREIAEAYEVLSDPERRARYDRGDRVPVEDLFSQFGGLEELLGQLFGSGLGGFGGFGGSHRRGPRRGADVTVSLELTLEEAAFGVEREITFDAPATCPACRGSGAAAGSGPTTCPTCGGRGRVRVARETLLGTMMSVTTCSTCAGAGSIVRDPCPECRGAGRTLQRRTVTVDVPPGVENGTRLRLGGRGGAGELGGPPGDLYAELTVVPDERFERHGDDLHHRAKVGFTEAVFGTEITVPLLDGGTEVVELPPGTQPGTVVRLARKGVPRLQRRGRGDLVIEVDVEVPTALSDEEEELLRRFAELRGEEPAPRRRRLFRR